VLFRSGERLGVLADADGDEAFTPPPGEWRDVLAGAPADYGLVLLERADAIAA